MPPPGYVTCQPTNATTEVPDDIVPSVLLSGEDDLNALLYIVVTLLFYSMGIIIGIITYLKREQAEMEEDKMFDMYMQLKREPFNIYKREKVNQMALFLKQLEEKQAAREKIENWSVVDPHQLQHPGFPQSPARRQQQHHGHPSRQPSPCPGCSNNLHAQALDGSAPLAQPESEWGSVDHRGGTALLCSLTLGVCEPLLTPESAKRVAFPDSPSRKSCSYTGSSREEQLATGRNVGKGDSYKSAFRHSFPSVGFSGCGPLFADGREHSHKHFTNEIQQAGQPQKDSTAIFDNKFDIELKDMRQPNQELIPSVFQEAVNDNEAATRDCDNSVKSDAKSTDVCDNSITTDEKADYMCDNPAKSYVKPIPNRSVRAMSLTPSQGKTPKLVRQLSYDPERKSAGLAIHIQGGRSLNSSPRPSHTGNNEPPLISFQNRHSPVTSSPLYELHESSTSNEDPNADGLASVDVTNVGNDSFGLEQPQRPQLEPLELAQQQQHLQSPLLAQQLNPLQQRPLEQQEEETSPSPLQRQPQRLFSPLEEEMNLDGRLVKRDMEPRSLSDPQPSSSQPLMPPSSQRSLPSLTSLQLTTLSAHDEQHQNVPSDEWSQSLGLSLSSQEQQQTQQQLPPLRKPNVQQQQSLTEQQQQQSSLLEPQALQQQHQPPQHHLHADVRPKVFPLSNIPRPSSTDHSLDDWTSNSDTVLPDSKKRHHSRLYDAWKKGNSLSLDIPRKADQQGKVKPADRKPARTQPERRGALFFTQKSLHPKDMDSPKSVSARKQIRPTGLFTRQESLDSSNSRSSEQSENLDSPLLQQGNDQVPQSTSSSPVSNTVSPPTLSKHQRRIPRLARSQTVDTSKLLDK